MDVSKKAREAWRLIRATDGWSSTVTLLDLTPRTSYERMSSCLRVGPSLSAFPASEKGSQRELVSVRASSACTRGDGAVLTCADAYGPYVPVLTECGDGRCEEHCLVVWVSCQHER